MNFQIRRVMEEDRAQVFDIYNTAIRDTLATLAPSPATIRVNPGRAAWGAHPAESEKVHD